MYEYTHMSDFIKILCVNSHSHSYSCKVIFYRKICIRFEIGSKYYIGYILKYLCSLISCEPYICTSVGILLSTSLRKSISFLVHCYFLCFYIYFSLSLSFSLHLFTKQTKSGYCYDVVFDCEYQSKWCYGEYPKHSIGLNLWYLRISIKYVTFTLVPYKYLIFTFASFYYFFPLVNFPSIVKV